MMIIDNEMISSKGIIAFYRRRGDKYVSRYLFHKYANKKISHSPKATSRGRIT